jgi:predicted  nucleic acid-binding Zn-ribbon protein
MSLFKERANNNKLVIALRNEIINYKNQIKELSASASSELSGNLSAELDALKSEHSQCMDMLTDLEDQLVKNKTEMKKIKSENTRLKKKLASFESQE